MSPTSSHDGAQTPTSPSISSFPGHQGSSPGAAFTTVHGEDSDTIRSSSVEVTKASTSPTSESGSDKKDDLLVHDSRLMGLPHFDPCSSRKLIDATDCLHIPPSLRKYSIEQPIPESKCSCLSWHASRLGTDACSAAIASYKQYHISGVKSGDLWIDAQQLIIENIAAALWSAYDAIRVKTGPVFDKLPIVDLQHPYDEYAEGHVQPWMTATLTVAIRDAVPGIFAKVDTLLELIPSDYQTFSFNGLGTPYNRINRAPFTCLCKEQSVFEIAQEKGIDRVHGFMELGTAYLLDEDDALEKAKEKASSYIMNVAQDLVEYIAEEGDEAHDCKITDKSHMKKWMRWHVEWQCDQAVREFRTIMQTHPQREADETRHRRHAKAKEEAEIKRLEEVEEQRPATEGSFEDARYIESYATLSGPTPYPGCECLWLGVSKIANKARYAASTSYEYPIASDWHDFLGARIGEAAEKAVKEIRNIISKSSKPGLEPMGQDTKDHCPQWYQDIIKERIDVAIVEAKERISENKGVPGAVAEAAMRDAQGRHWRYHLDVNTGTESSDKV